MALEAGGYADKLGNRYEASWVAYLLLELLEEKASSVVIEPLGDDEVGVDVTVERDGKRTEYHQCKVGNSIDEIWTISKLKSAGILSKALFQLRRGSDEFRLISPLSSKNLSDLCLSACNSNGNAHDFLKLQVNQSKSRKKLFDDFCMCCDINSSVEHGLNEAFDLLRRLKIDQYCEDLRSIDELEQKASVLYMGKASKLVRFLKHYGEEQNRLRKKITLPILLKDIANNGFDRRLAPEDHRVAPIIERMADSFVESIKPFLISNKIIPRPETQEVLNALDDAGIVLIKAEAGMGKSAALLEIHNEIQSRGGVSIPIRLDRNKPESNADYFGKGLGFPYSPIYCLAKFAPHQKCVVLLDQLDAVRWTASHSNNALDVFKELVKQVLRLREDVDISIILACRDFEIDEDPALRAWVTSLSDDTKIIKLGKLDSKYVAEMVNQYEPFSTLAIEKQDVLKIPLWLSIYLEIAVRDQCPPVFSSKLKLVRHFWINKHKELDILGINGADATSFLDGMVETMEHESVLSISEISIPINDNKIMEALISVGVLTKSSNRLSFRHQALYDFKLGQQLFEAACISESNVLSQLGTKAQQTLAKREHLKYGLNMLLAHSEKMFSKVALAILESPDIRFHMKYLVLNSLKDIDSLSMSSKLLFERILTNNKLEASFIRVSCEGKILFINYLIKIGKINEWLTGGNSKKIERVFELLFSISKTSPDIVLQVLEPFIDKSAEWDTRIYSALCWDMIDDSDAMFELRKRLILENDIAPFIRWRDLSEKYPNRVIELMVLIISFYRDGISATYLSNAGNKNKFPYNGIWTKEDINLLSGTSSLANKFTLSTLLSIVDVSSQDSDKAAKNWIEKSDLDSQDYPDTLEVLIGGVTLLILNVSKKIALENPQILISTIEPFLRKTSKVMDYLNANMLLYLPISFADFVIDWILDSTKGRLSCGNTNIEPKWRLPAKLVETFSPHCSSDNFERLEKSILRQQAYYDIESIKWKLKARRDGYFLSYWGAPQYFILPKLTKTKISTESVQLIAVLNRKFEVCDDDNFCDANNSRCGSVSSPLVNPNELSDRAWSKLILSAKVSTRNASSSMKWNENYFLESTVEQFSSSLEQATRNEPIRFANLALLLPCDIDDAYINALYRGLSEKDGKNIRESYQESWKSCSPALIERVIEHFGQSVCVYSLIRLLESRYFENGEWSVKTREVITSIAKTAEKPLSNKLSIVRLGESSNANDVDMKYLEGTAINSDRGIAYGKIASLFWDNESLSIELRGLIQNAIDDPHPSVNSVALQMVLPIYNYDQVFASKTFLTLCKNDIRMATARGSHYFYNSGFNGLEQKKYIELVLAMLKSSYDSVAKEGGKQVFARWYFNDIFIEEMATVLSGRELCREGAASVVAQLARNGNYHHDNQKFINTFKKLVNDESESVRETLSNAIMTSSFWNGGLSHELFGIYVESKAAFNDLWRLFHVIDEHVDNVLKYQGVLFNLVNKILDDFEEGKKLDVRESLISVLQKIYDQTVENEDSEGINLCLDMWDKLLNSNVYSAVRATKKLENGLLA